LKTSKAKNEFENLNIFLERKIKEMIKEKKLKPGEKIKQIDVAEKLGVSRTPLLKVLHKLSTENLIEYIPQKGFKVKKLTKEELQEVFEIREAIQGVCAKSVALKAIDSEIEKLKGCFIPFADVTVINTEEYIEADKKFHSYLIKFSRNSLMRKINDMYNIHSLSYQKGLIRPPEETISEHLALIAALENRDADRARLLAMQHIEKGTAFIAQNLQKT